MGYKIKAFLTSICLVILIGCTDKPVLTISIETPSSTPPVADTVTVTATSSPLPLLPTYSFEPTLTLVPEPTVVVVHPTLPAATLAESMMPSGFTPILYGKKHDANMFFLVLGGIYEENWLTPAETIGQFGGEWQYDVYPFSGGTTQVQGESPQYSVPGQGYFIGTDSTLNELGMVGVVHGWTPRQGTAQEISADNVLYQQVVTDWLREQSVTDPQLGTMHIFIIDLEADGVDEVFISATHLDESQHLTKAGDYSVILMRKVVGNDTVTIPVVADIYRSQDAEITYPRTYLLANFLDLDKDGILEVVVDFERWEEDGALIYQIDGQMVSQAP